MSETDSFIDEVTEEVRRDRLFALFRKYGWIGVVAVLAIVGGAAFNEWQKARAQARAQEFGDALIAALDSPDGAARATALLAVDAGGNAGRTVVADLLAASEAETAGNHDQAMEIYGRVRSDATAPGLYRDLARIKFLLLGGDQGDAAARSAELADLARPGAPYRTLAVELQALDALTAGNQDEAVTLLNQIVDDAATPRAQKGRIAQILTALGVAPAAPPADAAAGTVDQ